MCELVHTIYIFVCSSIYLYMHSIYLVFSLHLSFFCFVFRCERQEKPHWKKKLVWCYICWRYTTLVYHRSLVYVYFFFSLTKYIHKSNGCKGCPLAKLKLIYRLSVIGFLFRLSFLFDFAPDASSREAFDITLWTVYASMYVCSLMHVCMYVWHTHTTLHIHGTYNTQWYGSTHIHILIHV